MDVPLQAEADHLASLPRKRVITSAVIRDDTISVLCVHPTYKETWHLPGGTVEEGESPAAACRRECFEELGTTPVIGRLLAVQHVAPQGSDVYGALAFVYEASFPTGIPKLVLPADELRDAAFLDSEERATHLSVLARGFVDAAILAMEGGSVVEIDREGARL